MTQSAAPSSPPAQLTQQQITFTLIGTLLAMFLAALDQTIVSTAGPAIQKALKIDPSLYAWITTSYLVASTVMVPIYGKLSDLYGRRRILMTGIVIFLVGSAWCGLAGDAWTLIIARGVQGLGSAALFVSAFAIIGDIFPPQVRGKYTGLFGAVFGLSSVVGPLIGGFLTDNISWHWVFFVNLPLGAIAITFILSKMPQLKRDWGDKKPKVDVLGGILLAVAVIPLLLALSLGKTTLNAGETGFLWSSWQILSMFALSFVGLLAFLYTESKVEEPILDLKLFNNRTFAIGNLAAFVIGGGFLAAIVFLPLFMVNVVGLSATSSGLTTIPLTFGLVLGNIISGQIVSRIGRYKPLMIIGLLILMAGFIIMGFTLTPQSSQLEVTLKMIIVGIGLGPSIPLYTLAIQNAVEPWQMGVATSTSTFSRQMGSTIGVAILGTFFANALVSSLDTEMNKALKDAPASLKSQFSGFSSNSAASQSGEGASVSQGFNATKIKKDAAEKIKTQFNTARNSVEASRKDVVAALKNNDSAAKARLLSNPKTDARLKGLLSSPVPLPPQALDGALKGIDTGLDAAIAQINSSEKTVLSEVNTTIDKVDLGFKTAFTNAITYIYKVGLIIVALGLLITLFLPELPLRKTGGFGAAVE